MIEITRFDHIGMVVPEIAPQVDLLEKLFGFKQKQAWEDVSKGARGVLMDVPGRSGVSWEVLAPLSPDSPLQQFNDSPLGPGLHHVAIEVPDINAATEELRKAGVDPLDEGDRVTIGPESGGEGFTFQFFGAGASGPCGGVAQSSSESAVDDSDTLGIVGIDHICHAFGDRDELARRFGALFGMRQIWRTPDGEYPDYADLVLETSGQMLWEVIMPIGDESFIQRFLDRRGPSVHHIAVEVGDWQRAISACEKHGIEPFDEDSDETDGARWRHIFIHPRNTGGVLVQFFWEEKPGVWIRSDKIRPPGYTA